MLEHEMEAPNQHTEEELEAAYQAGYLACHDEQGLDTFLDLCPTFFGRVFIFDYTPTCSRERESLG